MSSVAWLLLITSSVPVAAASPSASVVDASFSGPDVATAEDGVTYVWQTPPGTFDVRIQGRDTPEQYRICLDTANGSPTCQYEWLGNGETKVVAFRSDAWNDSIGHRNLSVTLTRQNTPDRTIDSATAPVFVLRQEGDLDGDGLTNEHEIDGATRFDDADSDDDGLRDGEELTNYETDPLSPDTDGDGLRDQREIAIGSDPTASDSDDDGIDDRTEVEAGLSPTEPNPDPDGDALSNAREAELGTDPTDRDTDDDVLDDGLEAQLGTNPTSPFFSRILGVLLLVVAAVLAFRVWQHYRERQTSTRGGSDDADTSSDGDPGEILTDEDRILRMLQRNDGRMPQREITEQHDWSKSKVSRLLSKMEEDDEIKKISTGRENLITLYGHVPDGARTIFDDESE